MGGEHIKCDVFSIILIPLVLTPIYLLCPPVQCTLLISTHSWLVHTPVLLCTHFWLVHTPD